jgi:hypothetical protein
MDNIESAFKAVELKVVHLSFNPGDVPILTLPDWTIEQIPQFQGYLQGLVPQVTIL